MAFGLPIEVPTVKGLLLRRDPHAVAGAAKRSCLGGSMLTPATTGDCVLSRPGDALDLQESGSRF